MFYHQYDAGTYYSSHIIHDESGFREVHDHSVSFGYVNDGRFDRIANTWDDWHLIPSSRPSVVQSEPAIKYVDIPGSDYSIDLTDYLTGRPQFAMRKGSFSFIIDNGHEHWESIRRRMTAALHGKKLHMVLEDDPSYYYEGRFTVSSLEAGSTNSTISISYQVNPYKMKIVEEGLYPQMMIWDITNFDLDYDYYGALHDIAVPWTDYSGTTHSTREVIIRADDYTFVPVADWLEGSVTVKFGDNPAFTLTSGSASLGRASGNSNNLLTVSGNGRVRVRFRYGSL